MVAEMVEWPLGGLAVGWTAGWPLGGPAVGPACALS